MFATIFVVAVLGSLAPSGPIVTPEGIIQSYGIGARFGREGEFGIRTVAQGDESSENSHNLQKTLHSSQKFHGLHESLHSPQNCHGLHKTVHSSQNTHGLYKTGESSQNTHDLYKTSESSQNRHGLLGLHGTHDVHSLNSQKTYGGYEYYHSHGSSALSSLHHSHVFHSSYEPHGSASFHKVVIRRPVRQTQPVTTRSEILLKGIISCIKKDIFGNENCHPMTTQNTKSEELKVRRANESPDIDLRIVK